MIRTQTATVTASGGAGAAAGTANLQFPFGAHLESVFQAGTVAGTITVRTNSPQITLLQAAGTAANKLWLPAQQICDSAGSVIEAYSFLPVTTTMSIVLSGCNPGDSTSVSLFVNEQ